MPENDKSQRTEKPSQKRRRESRRQGQIARSPEISGWLAVLVGSEAVSIVVRKGYALTTRMWTQAGSAIATPSTASDMKLLTGGLEGMLGVVLPVAIVLMAIGVLVNLAQTGFAVAPSLLKPKLSRISPKAGIKRLVSPQAAWGTGKMVFRLMILALIGWRAIDSVMHTLLTSGQLGLFNVAGITAGAALGAAREMAVVSLAVAGVDYGLQRRKVNRAIKMTKQEVKEENKQSEGNPVIKGAVRRKQRSLTRHRMLAAVANADTVVVNPTHVAVALKYEAGKGAPRVVAKGADEVAARIRLEAEIHDVPIVRDIPLARALYGACAIDQEIPRELYEAVAKLLSFLYGLRRTGRIKRVDGGPLQPPAPLLPAPA